MNQFNFFIGGLALNYVNIMFNALYVMNYIEIIKPVKRVHQYTVSSVPFLKLDIHSYLWEIRKLFLIYLVAHSLEYYFAVHVPYHFRIVIFLLVLIEIFLIGVYPEKKLFWIIFLELFIQVIKLLDIFSFA